MTTPKIYSKTQIWTNANNRHFIRLSSETDIIATLSTPEKAKEFSDRLNQAIEDIFDDLTEGETVPEMSQKEREMVERCINLSALIRAKSDEIIALIEQQTSNQVSELRELLKQHSQAWNELGSEFGDKTGDLGDKPYFDECIDFGNEELIDWIKTN